MALLPPKLRNLPLEMLREESEMKIVPQSVWEIDVPSENNFLWAITLSYFTESLKIKNFQESFQSIASNIGVSSKGVIKCISHMKNITKKLNPFINYHYIYYDRLMLIFVRLLKTLLAQNQMPNHPGNISTNNDFINKAAIFLKCVIHVCKTNGDENIDLYSSYPEENNLGNKCLRLILFQQVNKTEDDSKVSEKFSYGISLNYANSLRLAALSHVLKRASLPQNEIKLVQDEVVKSDESFLICLLRSPSKHIIPKLYNSPYIINKLKDAGYQTDPKSPSKVGLSAFYYCVETLEISLLRILYHFSTNKVMMTDKIVNNPDIILKALQETAEVISMDFKISASKFDKKITSSLKTIPEILHFNKFQREVIGEIFHIKQENVDIEQHKNIMISILDKYCEYFFFSSGETDELKLFHDFVRHSEYYEYLDHFTCLLFFHNLPPLIKLITETNHSIYTEAVSSLFLNILNNLFFPKYEIDCRDCKLSNESCLQKHNSQRFIPFHYRTCFLKCAAALKNELRNSTYPIQSSSEPLLEEMTKGLILLPEIEDMLIIIRLMIHLQIVEDLSPDDSGAKRILTIDRTLQIIGEILQNETVSNTVTRSLLKCILPAELVSRLIMIRNHSLGHHRASSVQARVKMERDDDDFSYGIQKELKQIATSLEPVLVCQILRVHEFMINTGKLEVEKSCKKLKQEINLDSNSIASVRRELFEKQKQNLIHLLNQIIRILQNKLKGNDTTSWEDFKEDLDALLFLMNFVGNNCSVQNSKQIAEVTLEYKHFISKLDSVQMNEKIKELQRILSKYSVSLAKIFGDVKENELKLSFPHLSCVYDKMKGVDIFAQHEKNEIEQKIMKCLEKSANTLRILKEELKKGTEPEKLNEKLEAIIMKQKTKESISKCIPNKLLKVLKNLESVKEKDLESFYEIDQNMIQFKRVEEEIISTILKINFRPELKNKIIQIINQKVWFLINRISQLKRILIFKNENICFLWNSGRWKRNLKIEKRLKFLMIQRYLTEKDLRAPLEMLLFDCMNILDKKEFIDMWEKTNHMCIGADMIRFLAHGNPILESIGSIVYPEDVPSEIIDEIFELIKAEKPLRALSELWTKAEVGKISAFKNIVQDSKKDKWSGLRKQILQCERWEKYMSLLPLQY
ncbi:uncharacterized protein CDAR_5431 [Caerostris darwini]|uniref:Uncharacterized protein n=1 Tax=Caerostris darwini TaxID=1538125 RepID=A0AAV4MIK0_9ARAC|nr:uncharacterized protein CDAR_5431 [Caerostris darwini]